MLERFSREARAAVDQAHDEGRLSGAAAVLPGHLLVALLGRPAEHAAAAAALRDAGVRQDAARRVLARAAAATDDATPLDPDVLAGVGVDLDAVRRRAEESFGPGALDAPGRAAGGRLRFAPASRKALELALREAIALRSDAITDAHLLLAILRGADPSAMAVLSDAGADAAALRADVRARLAASAA